MRRFGSSHGLIWGVLLGCLVLFAMGAIGDFRQVGSHLATFPLSIFLVVLILSGCNYGARFWRWELYLRAAGVFLPRGQSARVFLSGLAFSVSPGKAGELVKAVMLKQASGVEVRKVAPVVVMERVSDLLGVVLLVLLGSSAFDYGRQYLWAGLMVAVLGVLVLCSRFAARLVSRLLPKHAIAVKDAQETFRKLLSLRWLLPSVVLSVVAWFAEGLGFWLVLEHFGGPLSVSAACFVYALATLVGALSLLPGGLGTTEGSMVGLLMFLHMDTGIAASATVLIRLCTLWFAVVVGVMALSSLRRLPRQTSE